MVAKQTLPCCLQFVIWIFMNDTKPRVFAVLQRNRPGYICIYILFHTCSRRFGRNDFLGRSTFPSSPLQYQRRGGARRFWWIKSLMTYKFVQSEFFMVPVLMSIFSWISFLLFKHSVNSLKFIKQCIRIDYNYSNFKRYVFIHLITSSLLIDDSERLLLNMK